MAGAKRPTTRRATRGGGSKRPTSTQTPAKQTPIRSVVTSSAPTTTETARRLGVSPATLRRWARRGVIRASRDSRGRYHFPGNAVRSQGSAVSSEGTAAERRRKKKLLAQKKRPSTKKTPPRKKRPAAAPVTRPAAAATAASAAPATRPAVAAPAARPAAAAPATSPRKKKLVRKKKRSKKKRPRPAAPPRRPPPPPPPPPPSRRDISRLERVELRQVESSESPTLEQSAPDFGVSVRTLRDWVSVGIVRAVVDADGVIHIPAVETQVREHVYRFPGRKRPRPPRVKKRRARKSKRPTAPPVPRFIPGFFGPIPNPNYRPPEPSREAPMPIAEAAKVVGEAMRDYVMARFKAERDLTHFEFYGKKESFRQTYGNEAWLETFDWIIDEWDLGDNLFDREALRDS